MNRTALCLTALLLTLGEAALALPSDFTLTGKEGDKALTGKLALDVDARTISLSVEGGAFVSLGGKLVAKGQRLEGRFRLGGRRGMANWIQLPGRGETWQVVVLPQGHRVDVTLTHEKRTLKLTGATPIGERHAGNEALIRTFYEAFARSDGATMASVYAANARFSDPVFPDLRGARIGAMWRSLCESKPEVTFSGVQADARYGKAQWIAKYEVFGRPVTNVIQASFEFKDGKVIHHVDHFSFKTWGSQAYGKTLTGLAERPLLSVTRMVTAYRLKKYLKKEAEAAKPAGASTAR